MVESYADRREARAIQQQNKKLLKLVRRGKIRVQPERSAPAPR